MKWSNVRLIFQRELRDQLRDRRTLFTIAVLPLLLYPLLGMIFLQIAQFRREHPTRILVIGADSLPESPALIENDAFSADFCTPAESRMLKLNIAGALPDESGRRAKNFKLDERDGKSQHRLRKLAQAEIESGDYDAVLYFPTDFGAKLSKYRERLRGKEKQSDRPSTAAVKVPEPRVLVSAANDRSQIALRRVTGVLERWREEVVRHNLEESKIPVEATQPFQVIGADVSEEISRRAAVWSKILPFVVLIWALTGAFYPAIDLCAGEKERGTLETLLSSPAQRGEIVWGKLLTVMSFSIATAVLNLASMGMTGLLIMKQIAAMGMTAETFKLGPPPISSVGWLLLAIVPISALFSALSLAIAAFARSSKEGQYYLMPLLLITLPLMILPLLPATDLDLGTSLIPITGVMLVLRSAIEGHYFEALRYVIPVVAVTGICCLFAIRWAAAQFNNESVLFRESERWGLKLWVRHVVRDRGETPTAGEAILCGLMLLVIVFFMRLNAAPPTSWGPIFQATVITQLALIATPPLLMTIMLTRSPKKTLMLQMPKRRLAIPAAFFLAVFLHPSVMLVHQWINQLYPISEDVVRALRPLEEMMLAQPLAIILFAFALLPAICEELAFRGFILTGLQQMGRKWPAILLSSIFFGVTHGMLQQSLAACMLGMVIGFVAVQTGSLLPAIVFHVTHNSLTILSQRLDPQAVETNPVLRWVFEVQNAGQIGYQQVFLFFSAAFALCILMWLRRLSDPSRGRHSAGEVIESRAVQALARP